MTIDGTIADVDRDREHPLDLGDRSLGHDPRRGQAGVHAVAQDLRVGRHERRIRVQAGDERLEPLGRVGRLELGQLRQQLLRPAHLVDDLELVEALVVLLDLQLGDDQQHVAGDPLLGRQARRSGWRAASSAVRSISARVLARPSGPGSSSRSA